MFCVLVPCARTLRGAGVKKKTETGAASSRVDHEISYVLLNANVVETNTKGSDGSARNTHHRTSAVGRTTGGQSLLLSPSSVSRVHCVARATGGRADRETHGRAQRQTDGRTGRDADATVRDRVDETDGNDSKAGGQDDATAAHGTHDLGGYTTELSGPSWTRWLAGRLRGTAGWGTRWRRDAIRKKKPNK